MNRRAHASPYEQLYQAVLLLAAEDATLQERLRRAYTHHLAPLDLDAFPADLRRKLERLRAELALYWHGDESRTISQDQAAALALRLLAIYDGSIP